MASAAPIGRAQSWVLDGDAGGTLAALTAQLGAGMLSPADQIRAVWWLRRFAGECASPGLTEGLLATLDPDQAIPPPMSIDAARFWLRSHVRNSPWGAASRLAREAGLHPVDLAKLASGGPMTAEKVERLAAAIIASGRTAG